MGIYYYPAHSVVEEAETARMQCSLHRDTSKPNPRAEKEPYLLKDMKINEVDQVWTSDISYIQIEQRNYYLCVVMDWDSRFVLGWGMGRNMDVGLCLKSLEMA